MLVQVQLWKESPLILSLRELCEEIGYSCEWRPGQPSYLIEKWRKNDCKTDSHILLVLPGVQATKHQSEGLDDRKQTQAVGDHERRVEIESPDLLSTIHGRIDEDIFKFDRRIDS